MRELSNPQAELALLAAVMRADAPTRAQIALRIRESWFTSVERVVVWKTMADLIAKDLPVDATLLADSLRSHGLEPKVIEDLAGSLARLSPTASFWGTLSDRVQGYYKRRRMAEIGLQMASLAADMKSAPDETLEQMEAEMFALHEDQESVGMRPIADFVKAAWESIEESAKNRGYVTGGIPTGFTDIDRCYIKGFRPGHVGIAGAPPGGGKTVFMMKIAYNIAGGNWDYEEGKRAREQGRANYQPRRVGVFTLEMDGVQLTERLMVGRSRVDLGKTQTGTISKMETSKLMDAALQLKKDGMLHIEHCPGASIQELRVKARYAVMRYKLEFICIDYAQLITSNTKAAQANRTQEMMDVSKGLKLLAQECRVPVLVLAQPKQETWGTRAPLSALGETSQLSKDADLIIMLGPWEIIQRQMKLPETPDEETCYCYADVVKNRHGANTAGKMPVKLIWERPFFDMVSTNRRLMDASGQNRQEGK